MQPINPYEAQIRSTALAYGVDPDMAVRVAHQESGINPNVKDSPAGAIGIMQLMPGTAQGLGVDPRDPSQNIVGGIRYLKQMQDQFKDPQLTLAAYNAGPRAVQKYLTHGRPLPAETQNYVRSISGSPLGSGKTPMANAMQMAQAAPQYQAPALSPQAQVQPGALFGGGNPANTPLGMFGGLLKSLGVGSADEVGRHLQNAGAGLIAIGNPSGGAALQNAANMPLFRQRFSVSTDAYGNRYIVNTHSGQVFDMSGRPIGGVPGRTALSPQVPQAAPQVPSTVAPQVAGVPGAVSQGTPAAAATDAVPLSPAAAQQEARNQAMSQTPTGMVANYKQQLETSAKTKSSLQQAGIDAQNMIDLARRQIELAKDPDVIQGSGSTLRYELANGISTMTGGAYKKAAADKTAEFDKNNAALLTLNKSALNGAKLAGPEIGFMRELSPDGDKPAAANLAIYQHMIEQGLRIQHAAQAAQNYSILGPKYQAELMEYNKQHPIYTDTQSGAPVAAGQRPDISSFNIK